MQTKTICFIGQRNLRFWKTALKPYKIERYRQGEHEGLRRQRRLSRTLRPTRADIVFARNCAERTTDRELAAIQRLIARSGGQDRLVINPQDDFHTLDSKDRAFTAWSRSGLACPRHSVLAGNIDSNLERVLKLLESVPCLLLRTNNEAESNGLHIVDVDTPADEIRTVLAGLNDRVAQQRASRCDTRAIAVEYIDARDEGGYATLARVFVLLDRVIGYVATVSNRTRFMISDMTPDCYDRWIEANRQLRRMIETPAIEADILRAVTSLRTNIGAVEFLVRDGSPVFLEVNPLWGGVPGPYSFGDADFERLLMKNEHHWSRELPNIVENLNVVDFYTRMYEYIAEYHEDGRQLRNTTLSRMAA